MTTLPIPPTAAPPKPYKSDNATQTGAQEDRPYQSEQSTTSDNQHQSADDEKTFTVTSDDWMMG